MQMSIEELVSDGAKFMTSIIPNMLPEHASVLALVTYAHTEDTLHYPVEHAQTFVDGVNFPPSGEATFSDEAQTAHMWLLNGIYTTLANEWPDLEENYVRETAEQAVGTIASLVKSLGAAQTLAVLELTHSKMH